MMEPPGGGASCPSGEPPVIQTAQVLRGRAPSTGEGTAGSGSLVLCGFQELCGMFRAA